MALVGSSGFSCRSSLRNRAVRSLVVNFHRKWSGSLVVAFFEVGEPLSNGVGVGEVVG